MSEDARLRPVPRDAVLAERRSESSALNGETPMLLAPMRVEAIALRSGAAGRLPVLRTGTGPVRARRAAARLGRRPAAVVGVGGGLHRRLATGDVVVATELRTTEGADAVAPVPDTGRVAAALRAAGLTVHTGPVVSAHRIVAGRARWALADTGALLVDTESYWLLGGGPVRTVACVRVVADVVPDAVLRPATLWRLRAALRRLPAVGHALVGWADGERAGPGGVEGRMISQDSEISVAKGVR